MTDTLFSKNYLEFQSRDQWCKRTDYAEFAFYLVYMVL